MLHRPFDDVRDIRKKPLKFAHFCGIDSAQARERTDGMPPERKLSGYTDPAGAMSHGMVRHTGKTG
jgi:hypothetical protein